MLTMIRRNTYAKNVAFKALDYAITRCTRNCEMFIDEGGLKTVFGAYMYEPSTKKERSDQTANELYLLEIICQLFLHCVDIRYLRLRAKFEEQEMVKTERTVELLVKYQTRVDDAELKHRRENPDEEPVQPITEGGEISDGELLRYSRQSDHGLSHVEMASIIIAFLATSGNKKLRSRIDQLLNQQDLSMNDLHKTIVNYTRMMGDGQIDEEQIKNKEVLKTLAQLLKEGE